MRRKRFAGARTREFKGMLVSKGFSPVRGIRFTLPFGEAMTIAAEAGGRAPSARQSLDHPLAITAKLARERPRPSRAVDGRDHEFRGLRTDTVPGAGSTGWGTRASANTSGPDFTWGQRPGEIADPGIRTERRKPVSSAGPSFERANSFELRSSRLT